MTFILPPEHVEAEERSQLQAVERSARASGTPFLSFYGLSEMLSLAREAGFRHARTKSTADLSRDYFRDRTDGLRPPSGEAFLLAST